MQRVNIIGAGKVGRTLMTLLSEHPSTEPGCVFSRRFESAQDAVSQTGAGRPAPSLAEMRPADIWFLTVPDDGIAKAAQDLADLQTDSPASIAVHCSGFLSSAALSPLQAKGWATASCHPVLSFANPQIAAQQFPGTYCAIEGDEVAEGSLRTLMAGLGAVPFAVDAERKALYHGAAVISNNFTVVLQALALEAWAASGVPKDVAQGLCRSLLNGTAANLSSLTPAEALTGPAARGDLDVLEKQEAAVGVFHPDGAELYRTFSLLARRLKTTGTTLPDT